MAGLADETPALAQRGSSALDDNAIAELKAFLPDWTVLEVDSVKQLQRKFKFKDFKNALEFTNKVGRAAEAEDHHPSLLTEWGAVTVTWWTHSVKGLHRNDFIMAARTDEIYSN